MTKPHILFLTGLDPRQASYGGEQRTHFIWEALKQVGDVQTVVLRAKCGVLADDPEQGIRTVGSDSSWFLLKALDRLLIRISNGCRFPWHARRTVERLVAKPGVKYDVVVCRYLTAMALVSAWRLGPCVVDVDDYPPALAKSLGLSGWRRLLIGWWTRYLLRRCRVAWIPDVAQIPVVSQWTMCQLLPNLAHEPSANYSRELPRKMQLMTVGYMLYQTNHEGVDWFLSNVWPRIHARFPELRYAVAGSGAPVDCVVRWRTTPGVDVLGFVDDLERLYAESLAVVAPIRTGAGTCIKVLEAAIYGRAVLATPFAVRGFDAAQCESLGMTVSEDAEAYVAALEAVLREDGAARNARESRIAAAAREINSFARFTQQIASSIQTAITGR